MLGTLGALVVAPSCGGRSSLGLMQRAQANGGSVSLGGGVGRGGQPNGGTGVAGVGLGVPIPDGGRGGDSGGAAGRAGGAAGAPTAGMAGVAPVVTALALGMDHSCALLDDGSVHCWGAATRGALGYGNLETIGDDETVATAGAVKVGAKVVALSAGSHMTCALTTSGTVRCWGLGDWGQLGYGNGTDVGDDETPASAGDVDVGDTVVEIAVGHAHTCARLMGGRVRCWGYGDGRLGYGNVGLIGDDEPPSSAGDVDVGGTVVALAAGGVHTCALLATGTVRCWGLGNQGVLGYGDTETVGDDETPAERGDVDVGGPVKQIVAGAQHTCALLTTGAVRCWGYGGAGRLGYGNEKNVGDVSTPAAAGDIDLGGLATALTTNGDHTCALLTSGKVRCWGDGSDGKLGYGNTLDVGASASPAAAGDVSLAGVPVAIAAGRMHTCALFASHAVRCWGRGAEGEIGYGNPNDIGDDEVPAAVGYVDVF